MKVLFCCILALMVMTFGQPFADAQNRPGVHRIGVLMSTNLAPPLFAESLRDLGYTEGRNIIVETRSANGKTERLHDLTAELVRLKVSVIVASGPTAIGPAMKATSTIPIVMVDGGNPVGRGFVQTLSRPGGNVTGLASATEDDVIKQLEILTETVTPISRIALLVPQARSLRLENFRKHGAPLGLTVEPAVAGTANTFETVYPIIAALRPDALIVARNTATLPHYRSIAEFALARSLPAMGEDAQFVEAGGLLSYGINHKTTWRHAAIYVDKILKGANPAVLAILPPQYELAVNLITAKKLGRSILPQLLLEASQVVR